MKSLFHAFVMCQSMFCAIPCPVQIWDEQARDKLLWCLPLVGLEIGLVWWLGSLLCDFLALPVLIQGAVLCAAPWNLTGSIHLDGFMDVTDAVRSCRDLDRRREILKDSHVGSFAVIGSIALTLFQFAFCTAAPNWADAKMLILIPVVSRCASAVAVAVLPKMSTSQYVQKKARAADICIPGAALLLCLAGALCIWPTYVWVIAAELTVYGLALRRAYKSLGGMNGDISGYCLTLAELGALGAMALL